MIIKWLHYCTFCRKNHYVKLKKCPGCNVYMTPQPVSINVENDCCANYECDGCLAYKEHLY